jgi:hypothetical protein
LLAIEQFHRIVQYGNYKFFKFLPSQSSESSSLLWTT